MYNNSLYKHLELIINRIKAFILFYCSKKVIYLTFDDGPLLGTKNCYEICMKLNTKATFFVVGSHVDSDAKANLLKLIRDTSPQVCIANHSFSHANEQYIHFYKYPLNAEKDFYKCQELLKLPFKIIRLPGFNAWAKSDKIKSVELVKPVCHLLSNAGYDIIGWDLEYNSYSNNSPILELSPEELIKSAIRLLKSNKVHKRNKLVILLHDIVFQEKSNIKHLQSFIFLMKNSMRCEFDTIDNY